MRIGGRRVLAGYCSLRSRSTVSSPSFASIRACAVVQYPAPPRRWGSPHRPHPRFSPPPCLLAAAIFLPSPGRVAYAHISPAWILCSRAKCGHAAEVIATAHPDAAAGWTQTRRVKRGKAGRRATRRHRGPGEQAIRIHECAPAPPLSPVPARPQTSPMHHRAKPSGTGALRNGGPRRGASACRRAPNFGSVVGTGPRRDGARCGAACLLTQFFALPQAGVTRGQARGSLARSLARRAGTRRPEALAAQAPVRPTPPSRAMCIGSWTIGRRRGTSFHAATAPGTTSGAAGRRGRALPRR